jgi:hypothetical protein
MIPLSTVSAPTPPLARPTFSMVPVSVPWFDTAREPEPLRPTPMKALSPTARSSLPAR